MKTLAFALAAVAVVALGTEYRPLDGLDGVLWNWVLTDDAQYANGYSAERWRQVREDMTPDAVKALIGTPLIESWAYPNVQPPGCYVVDFRNDKVIGWMYSGCATLGVRDGIHKADAVLHLSLPEEVWWRYSISPNDTHYRQRIIRFRNNRVVERYSGWYID